jgi:thioredoxin 1
LLNKEIYEVSTSVKQTDNRYVIRKKGMMIEHLTKETFLTKVFNYEKNSEWKFEGSKPCIIDFYADWCGPCKIVAPVLEDLAKDYDGRVDVFKVDTEAELELSSAFGIRSIPSFLFVPVEGQPQMAMGALPKEVFVQAFREVLGVEK